MVIMNCFVVVYDGNFLVMQRVRNDDGASIYEYAKKRGYSVRKWEMYGKLHVAELIW